MSPYVHRCILEGAFSSFFPIKLAVREYKWYYYEWMKNTDVLQDKKKYESTWKLNDIERF